MSLPMLELFDKLSCKVRMKIKYHFLDTTQPILTCMCLQLTFLSIYRDLSLLCEDHFIFVPCESPRKIFPINVSLVDESSHFILMNIGEYIDDIHAMHSNTKFSIKLQGESSIRSPITDKYTVYYV